MCEEWFPPRFWGLDPLFSAKAKLNIGDVLALSCYPEFPGVHCIGNHPVVGVHVMGDVVSVKKKSALILYEVDDGSGVLSCCQWRRSEDSEEGLYLPSIGQLVSVFGRVEEFRGERQLRVLAIVPESDPNAEPLHWLEVEHLKRTVYSQPFSLPEGVLPPSQHHIRPLREVVEGVVMEFLKTREGSFTLSSLTSSEELRQAVWEGVRRECEEVGEGGGGQGGKVKMSEEEVSTELREVVKKMPQLGVAIPLNPTTLKLEVEYEFFSEEKHLFPVILDFMKTKLQHPKTSQLGVPKDWVVQHVRGRESLHCVSPATVAAAVEHLEEASLIFSVGGQAYKMVT